MTTLEAYQTPTFDEPIELDLSRNEGRPWAFENNTPSISVDALSRYPDTSGLREMLAEWHGVDTGQVLVTAGGDDALARCFFSRPGSTVTATRPSFEMIERYSQQTGGIVRSADWWDEPFPVEEFLAAARDSSMAVIVSPNNPTGNVVTTEDLGRVAAEVPLVVLDGAYSEFADLDLTPRALEMGNVVTIRTLSKAFGLAGLRVGYLLGSVEFVSRIAAFGSPFAVSGFSSALASAALPRRKTGLEKFIATVRSERGRLFQCLTELSVRPLPSQANFVLASDVDADRLVAVAASMGVGLRSFPGRPDLRRCVRISLPGQDEDYRRLEMTVRSILSERQDEQAIGDDR